MCQNCPSYDNSKVMELLKENVKATAEWMDVVEPGWMSRINLDTLNVDNPTYCVAGQVWAEKVGVVYRVIDRPERACDCGCSIVYSAERVELSASTGYDYYLEYEFPVPAPEDAAFSAAGQDYSYADLTDEWKRYITAAREAATV